MSKEKQNTPTNTPTQKQFTNCELKQIEEMARIIGHCESTLHPDIECHNKATGCYCIENPCHNQRIAEKLYNAGYRKQSEGEWIERDCIIESKRGRTIHYSIRKCSVCGKWNGRHKTNFCPNCGANMKGGAE